MGTPVSGFEPDEPDERVERVERVRDETGRLVRVDAIGFALGGVLGPGTGVVPVWVRGSFGDGFPWDFRVLDREGRGFWGISAELGIRQASRWGSGSGRVDPPR
jgi:hypothetical protein